MGLGRWAMGKKKKAEQDNRLRGVRGGCWFFSPANARVADRYGFEPGYQDADLSVRLVRRRSALERLVEACREVDDGQEEG